MTSNIHRFLSRRDRRQKTAPADSTPDEGTFAGFFVPDEESKKKKFDKDEEKSIKTILARLQSAGITMFNEANVDYALRSKASQGNMDEAFRLLLLFEDTYEGLVKTYNPSLKLLGAENRQGVTCYLDALLFAMFARLDSFEAMLYNSFEDAPRKKLAGLMRLWVNMLRDGKLITTDITKYLQEALSECGWDSAAKLIQQDTSEAFTFITGQLELPLLTLKMDLYHTGKEEPNDDHKFVNERLLEVAILSEPLEGTDTITLEDCLENYFNNRIEVKRHMERNRSNTLQSAKSDEASSSAHHTDEKTSASHIETVEYAEGAISDSPVVSESPIAEAVLDTPTKSHLDKLRPASGRKRADSIFSQRRVAQVVNGVDPEAKAQRKGSIRTEVLMPAWQFFKLLPWYTDNVPTSDAQVAAHFSHKRPVLGIALKRYQVTMDGVASRLDTYVDIPLEIAVPNFVTDDNMDDDSPLVGNFKLVLQSVVCHRGTSVNSGHYISLVRGQAANAKDRGSVELRPDSPYSDDEPDPWMLFDDLAKDRVTYVDINQKLREECPYLLFYQVQPIDDVPPTYEESCSRIPSAVSASPEKLRLLNSFSEGEEPLDYTLLPDDARAPASPNGAPAFTEAVDWSNSTRTSLDINTTLDRGRQLPKDVRGRTSMSSNRSSALGMDEQSLASNSVRGGTSVPGTPVDESRTSFLGLPTSRRGSKANIKSSKSRPNSQGAEERTGRFGIPGFGMTSIKNMGRSPSRQDLTSLGKTTEEVTKPERSTTTPVMEKTGDTVGLPKHSSLPSVSGSVASLEDRSNGAGSSESLHSKPESIAIAELAEDHKKKNWKEKMEARREERSRIREEKHRDKEDVGEGHKKKSNSGKKSKKEKSGEVPDRECVVM